MSLTAQLRASLHLPGGAALVNGSGYESRAGARGVRRALLEHGHELEVYDLDELLAGERAPIATFPLPWPGWCHGVHSVSPAGDVAVFSGQRAVRAVGLDGQALWEYRHACWGPELGHPHTGEEQQVCRGSEHGSCRVSDDGSLVWAHVVVEPEPGEWQEVWVVLDARDGRELARLPLESAAAGSHQMSHPDGVHMGLEIGMGQDGILLHWARWDGEQLTGWDLNEGMDRILMDVHPAHPGFLTVHHDGWDVRLHALDGSVLARREAPADEDAERVQWSWVCGFVDAATVIAASTDRGRRQPRHWLLDARTLEIRGEITYPGAAVDGCVRPLGDGTWLTYAGTTGTLTRWAAAPA
ncbi:hypothetical protein [Streptacidiphilus jiangxiensis]|uniref:Arylsulfotransferase (ASST) n=1 Tax=Streptacidiphilus jiangxiensis TaxID=235985 RepID=A0A1H7UMD4_STRJI|nr:hypothetical protein [Streptacidiphilus jiangxiensis]SEL98190.1 hypothetical protein SAMN05414137_11653 [Streptacidiphilus jiangxiensis]